MSERLISRKRSAVWIDLGILEYKRALQLQIDTLELKIKNPLFDDHIFFVEHPPVFTLGRRGGEENLTVTKDFLSLKHIDMIATDRGGNITYHGPGQAVLYPVIDLERNKIGVKDYVFGLEEIMKRTALDFDIDADRSEINHGLFVGKEKLGSVGISVKKGMCHHGLSMNIHCDLTPFSWINPCGLTGISMTSIKNELQKKEACPKDPSMKQIQDAFMKHFSFVLDYEIWEKHEN